jgi:hypothetical protein
MRHRHKLVQAQRRKAAPRNRRFEADEALDEQPHSRRAGQKRALGMRWLPRGLVPSIGWTSTLAVAGRGDLTMVALPVDRPPTIRAANSMRRIKAARAPWTESKTG